MSAPSRVPTTGYLPAQFEARTRYPDGSIQWLWADFQARAEDSGTLMVGKSREDLRLQIKHVAEQVSLDENTIIGWESRGVKPKKPRLLKLLQFYLQKGANPV